MKKAILQVDDTGPLESLRYMLETAGYECFYPNVETKTELRRIGCDCIQDMTDMEGNFGYEPPRPPLPVASMADVDNCNLFAHVKAHTDYDILIKRWPALRGKILWYCINGGDPGKRTDAKPWVLPLCPVLTPNQWYTGRADCLVYVCYPPFVRARDYSRNYAATFDIPVCLVHSVFNWGLGNAVEPLRALGVKCYGANAPDGLLPHKVVAGVLANALCMVHIKAGDAGSYAIYEACAAACPILCTQAYIDDVRYGGLLEPGVTCLTFDPADLQTAKEQLESLKDAAYNRQIGLAARKRLLGLAWEKERDGPSLAAFLGRAFRG